MSENNPLHRFSNRRRLRRVADVLRKVPVRVKTSGKESVRGRILRETSRRLTAAGRRFHLSRSQLIEEILDWFVVQSKPVQSLVLARHVKGASSSPTVILRELLAPNSKSRFIVG